MEIHNISEDVVVDAVQTIFDAIKREGNPSGLCLCDQCRLDTICYALNRIEPKYIISNRGLARIEQDWTSRQQTEADVSTLVYRALQRINHNQRPTATHDITETLDKNSIKPAFDIPTIMGRLFNGETFAPVAGVTVELRCKGEIVPMRNRNWQNPFTLIMNTPGTFTFWPAPVTTEKIDTNRVFEYSLKIESPEYETVNHFFNIPMTSTLQGPGLYSLDKTFKLPDLYLFPPGEAELNG